MIFRAKGMCHSLNRDIRAGTEQTDALISCLHAPMSGFVVYLIFLTLFVLLGLEASVPPFLFQGGFNLAQNSRVLPRFAYTVILYYAPETLRPAVILRK